MIYLYKSDRWDYTWIALVILLIYFDLFLCVTNLSLYVIIVLPYISCLRNDAFFIYFYHGVKWSKIIFVSPRVGTHVLHQSFSTRGDIENFTQGWNFTCDGTLNRLNVLSMTLVVITSIYPGYVQRSGDNLYKHEKVFQKLSCQMRKV